MAFGKNKGLAKGKKGNKKKQVDPFTKKVWYEIRCPTFLKSDKAFQKQRTMVTKTQGTRIETEGKLILLFLVSAYIYAIQLIYSRSHMRRIEP